MPRKLGLKITYPAFQEKLYTKELLDFCQKAIELTKANSASYLETSYAYRVLKQDDFNSDFQSFLEVLKARLVLESKSIISKIPIIAQLVSNFHERSFLKSLNKIVPFQISSLPTITPRVRSVSSPTRINTIGITEVRAADELKMWISQNVKLIKSIPENLLTKVEQIVTDSIRVGYSSDTLAEKLEAAFNITKKRAKFIARDQINKLHGNLTRVRNLELGILEYKWITGRDGRVRHSHEVLESKICSWENPAVFKNLEEKAVWKDRSGLGAVELHPGQDILCRCTSIAVIN